MRRGGGNMRGETNTGRVECVVDDGSTSLRGLGIIMGV